jgi:hypothetical protein
MAMQLNFFIKLVSIILSIVAFGTLSGCNGPRMYAPPESGETAFIKFVNREGLPFKQYLASVATYDNAESCQGKSWMHFYLNPGSADYTKISAGRLFAMSVHAGEPEDTSLMCVLGLRFTPEAGRYYEAQHFVDPREKQCYLLLRSSDSPSMAHARVEKPELLKPTFESSCL